MIEQTCALDVRDAVVALREPFEDRRLPRAHRAYYRQCLRIACSGLMRIRVNPEGSEDWLVPSSALDERSYLARLDKASGWRCSCGTRGGGCEHVGAILTWTLATSG